MMWAGRLFIEKEGDMVFTDARGRSLFCCFGQDRLPSSDCVFPVPPSVKYRFPSPSTYSPKCFI